MQKRSAVRRQALSPPQKFALSYNLVKKRSQKHLQVHLKRVQSYLLYFDCVKSSAGESTPGSFIHLVE